MQRVIRLHYERVVVAALLLAVVLPLYFMLTGFAVVGAHDVPVSCGATVTALGESRVTTADPSDACHAAAVQRLHLALGYLTACIAVGALVWLIAGARERALNRAWADARVPSRWMSTPTQVWVLAALLFVVFAGSAQGI
ncbi:MAG TPA: hypothetical protein VGU73_09855 [Acidimicrobiia bacterium]|nr:hypothetical protein [Acidimicrobiia bacterium]